MEMYTSSQGHDRTPTVKDKITQNRHRLRLRPTPTMNAAMVREGHLEHWDSIPLQTNNQRKWQTLQPLLILQSHQLQDQPIASVKSCFAFIRVKDIMTPEHPNTCHTTSVLRISLMVGDFVTFQVHRHYYPHITIWLRYHAMCNWPIALLTPM